MTAPAYWDLFCGAGGASNGMIQAASAMGHSITDLVAVNHWRRAVETHRANHPWANVMQEDVSRVDPRPLFKGKRVKLGVAGPSCVHFSQARGGMPVSDQERSHALDVVRWARLTEAENLIIENVPAFQTWGPLRQKRDKKTGDPLYDKKGEPLMEPDPARKSEYFNEFLASLRRLGYNVDWRVLCAAHYGDATTRRRLFVQARRGRITWPEPTHRLRDEQADLFGLPIARSAGEIIDWNLPTESIWTRKKPLCAATMAQIMEGLRRYVGGPFIVPQLACARVRSLDEPMNTIMGTGTGNRLVEPFLLRYNDKGRVEGLNEPITTVDGSNRFALVEPFLIPHFGEREGQRPRTHGISDPLPAVTSHGAGTLVEPFLIGIGGPRSRQAPASMTAPLGTILSQNHTYVVEPFLMSYYGNGSVHSLKDGLPTATGKDRFALIETVGRALEQGVTVIADIRTRMLQPHELAAAHSFPADYQFCGTKGDAVKMVGNSWPVATAQALCREVLG